MIPIQNQRFLSIIKKIPLSLKFIFTILFLGVLIIVSYYEIKKDREEFIKGTIHKELDKKIADRLLDSSYLGLCRFKKVFGYYPNMNGKYFFDSIKIFIGNIEPYVYADTLGNDGIMRTKRNDISFPDYLYRNYCFIGVGIPEITIIYRIDKQRREGFILYSVGNNYKDEYGKGDDIVWEPKKWYDFIIN